MIDSTGKSRLLIGKPRSLPIRLGRTGGFTLIELLTVMAIMVLVTTVAISNYSGMARAAAYRAAQDVVFNTLQMAKQRACIGGHDVFVVFPSTNEFSLIEGNGTISRIDNIGRLYDFYPDFETAVVTNCIWNLSNPSVTNSVKMYFDNVNFDVPLHSGNDTVYGISNVRIMEVQGGGKKQWAVGDKYGTEVAQSQRVAKGYKIDVDSADKAVCFHPDGSSSTTTLTIAEYGIKNPLSFVIRVENGEIKCE